MEPIASTTAVPLQAGVTSRNGVAELSSDDFFKLLISELSNQDPLEPMDNQQLLNQISSIRDIELSSTLTESLQSLADQQNIASVTALIGKHVSTSPNDDGGAIQGVVVAVRRDESDQILLQLADGTELELEDVATVQTPTEAAQSLVGKAVSAVDRKVPGIASPVHGQVTGVSLGSTGEVLLQLDNNQTVSILDIIGNIGAIGDEIARVF